jgi:hypothetical protein
MEDKALWMIVRAGENARLLEIQQTNAMAQFSDWFSKNIVGDP